MTAFGPAWSGSFPRWGYLDKFYVNEYLARALLVSLGLTLAASAALRHAGSIVRPMEPPSTAVHPVFTEVNPFPPPLIERQPIPGPGHSGGGHPVNVKSGAPHPVPTPPAQDIAWEPGSQASGPPGTDASGSAEPSVSTGGGLEALPAWDAVVPFEKEPQLINIETPVYPELAREAGVEGQVIVRVLVGVDGLVKDAAVVQSVLMLDEAALAAAHTAVFRPALQQEHPVAVWVSIPIEFDLRR